MFPTSSYFRRRKPQARELPAPPLWAPVVGLLLFLAACGGAVETPTPVRAVVVTSLPTPTVTAQPSPTLPSPTMTPPATATRLPPTPDFEAEPGGVTGSLCYPSISPPPMTLFVENIATGVATMIEIAQGQKTYRVAGLPPGDYTAYAQTVGTALTGAYSSAVPCGLGRTCTDHRLLPFQIESKRFTQNIDLCDWYSPPGIVEDSAGLPVRPEVMVTTLQNTNVFSGPALAYPVVGLAPPRYSARAVGRNKDSSWLQIEFLAADAGLTWIYSPLLQLSADPARLPLVKTAPPPDQPGQTAPTSSRDQFAPPAWPGRWSIGYNDSLVHFKGFIRDEAGNPVNGFSILADNGTWSVLSHPTGASHHYPDYENGEWDIMILNATDAAGWWTLTVVRYECPNFDQGFNAQCKHFTRLSEDYVVKVIYPDGSIITADWLCHRGCDKGLYVEAYRP